MALLNKRTLSRNNTHRVPHRSEMEARKRSTSMRQAKSFAQQVSAAEGRPLDIPLVADRSWCVPLGCAFSRRRHDHGGHRHGRARSASTVDTVRRSCWLGGKSAPSAARLAKKLQTAKAQSGAVVSWK